MQAPWIIVTTGIHDRGGQDKANYALAEYLLQQGKTVHLVSHSVGDPLQQHPHAVVHHVPRPAGPFLFGETVLDYWGRAVARKVSRQYPNVRVVANGGNCLWPGINWAHYVHHGWDARNESAPLWYRLKSSAIHERDKARERRAYRSAKLIITNSDNTKDLIHERCGVPSERLQTIYLGCDSGWDIASESERENARKTFQADPSRRLAVFVGGLGWDDRKGFHVLFDVWQKLCSQPEWDVDLVVAGGGTALASWQNRVEQAGLSARIRFLGFTTKVRELLAAADLMLSPIQYEPYGLNVQESICRGVPTIVSRCAGSAERYPSSLSEMLLSNPTDRKEVEAKLLLWRSETNAWRIRFERFGNQLRSYTWADMAARIVELVENTPQESRIEAMQASFRNREAC